MLYCYKLSLYAKTATNIVKTQNLNETLFLKIFKYPSTEQPDKIKIFSVAWKFVQFEACLSCLVHNLPFETQDRINWPPSVLTYI